MQGRTFLYLENRGLYSFTTRQRLMMRIGLYDLGRVLHPQAITGAWYAADCPPKLDYRSLVPLRVRLQWRLACWLRGCK